MDNKDIIGVIENRRSIRAYQDKRVSHETLEKILHYGTLAPSAKNKQPWNFIVISEDIELKNKIADLMIEKAKLDEKSDPTIVVTANIIKEAPVLILTFNKFNEQHLISNTLSIGACIENMLLVATGYGLGSVWIRNTYIVEKEICEMFNKKDVALASAIALGYANEFPNPRPRIPIKEIAEWL